MRCLRSIFLASALGLLASCGSLPAPVPPPAPTGPSTVLLQGLTVDQAHLLFSPDDRLVAVVDRGLSLIDAASGEVRARFPGCVAHAAFYADSAAMIVAACPSPSATAPRRRTVLSRWDLALDRVERVTEVGDVDGLSLVDGERAVAVWNRVSAAVWRFAEQRFSLAIDQESATRAAVSASGERALFLLGEERDAVVFDAAGKVLWRGQVDRDPSESTRNTALPGLSPDGDHLLARQGGAIRVIQIPEGKVELERPVAEDCYVLGFSPDSVRAAYACPVGGEVTVLDRGGAACRLPFPPPSAEAAPYAEIALRWTADGARAALHVLSGPTTAQHLSIWNIKACARERADDGFDPDDEPAFSPKLTRVAYAPVPYDGKSARERPPELRVRDLATFTERGWPARPSVSLSHRHGDVLVFSAGQEQLFLFDPAAARRIGGALLHAGGGQIELRTDRGSRLLHDLDHDTAGAPAIARPGGARIELSRVDETLTERGHRTYVVSPRGGFVSITGGSSAGLWNATTGELVAHAASNLATWPKRGFELDRDETRAAVFDRDAHQLLIVDARSGQSIAAVGRVEDRGQGADTSFAFSPAGKLIAAQGVGVIEATTGKVLWKAPNFVEQPWSPDGRFVVTGEEQGCSRTCTFTRVDVREAATGRLVKTLDGAGEVVGWGGDLALSVDREGVYRVWSTRDWKVVREHSARSVQLSADGRFTYLHAAEGLWVERASDGMRLLEVLPERAEQDALVFAEQLFDGPAAALGQVRLRAEGDLRSAPLRGASARDAHPGLARDFFAERPIGPAPPPIEVTAGDRIK